MALIILSDEQAKVAKATSDAVELRDVQGNLLGYLTRSPSDEEVALARRRLESDGPWCTTEQILKHLESLEQG